VRFGQRVIELKGAARWRKRAVDEFLRRAVGVTRQGRIAICQSSISQGVRRIFVDRLLKILRRLPQVCFRPAIPKKPALEIEFVRFRIFCRLLCDRRFLRAAQFRLQRVRDSFRDVAFDCEDVG
jgi:hypothetical protein